ncbi:MAG: DNA alkylation repair protein, partial [Gemmatimonadetes bacterium]|nr:DNA alkylation repair protein [Gemmatimonadota bacterium]
MARATVSTILAELKRRGSKSAREGMARYGIGDETALGVQVNVLRAMAKRIGRDHALALALWKTGVYEARMLATLVDEPEKVTLAQMDSWCRDFDTWALCDTACFSLWDQTPHAWTKVRAWAPRKEEFVRRAAFALIASLSVHDKKAPDAPFRRSLELIERYATDERNFV